MLADDPDPVDMQTSWAVGDGGRGPVEIIRLTDAHWLKVGMLYQFLIFTRNANGRLYLGVGESTGLPFENGLHRPSGEISGGAKSSGTVVTREMLDDVLVPTLSIGSIDVSAPTHFVSDGA